MTPSLVFQQEAQQLLDKYREFTIFYINGSKTVHHVCAALVTDEAIQTFQLPLASVFTSELYAVLYVHTPVHTVHRK